MTDTPTTSNPSQPPSISPSNNPSTTPTNNPTYYPSYQPSQLPTSEPSIGPSNEPSQFPSEMPSLPTAEPSANPSLGPTINPSLSPTTQQPSQLPSKGPTISPTNKPSHLPTSTDAEAGVGDSETTQAHVADIHAEETYEFRPLPWFIGGLIVLCCCICGIVCVCKCLRKRRVKKSKYETKGYMHEKMNSRSVMKHPIGNQQKPAILQMNILKSISTDFDMKMGENEDIPDQDLREGTGTGTGSDPMTYKETNSGAIESPNTPGNVLMNDEFIIEDDNELDVITAGSNNQYVNEANALLAIGNDDEVITGSDHETPNDTTESDEQIGDDEIIIGDPTIGDD